MPNAKCQMPNAKCQNAKMPIIISQCIISKMNPDVVNELLQASTKLKRFVVTECLPEQKNVFKAIDTADPTKQIIVKITSLKLGEDPQLPQLQPYVQLSEHCNICKLLDYELVGYPSTPHVITVMENCGTDLFSFIIGFLHDTKQIDLNLILSIALQLLDQISCLQRHNAVHGDIKVENVLIDDTGKVTLVDFDKLPVINKNRDGTFTLSGLTLTKYDDKKSLMRLTVKYYETTPDEVKIIEHIFFKKWLLLESRKLWGYSNVPHEIYRAWNDNIFIFTFPTQESVNIIDWYSWSYVILMLLYVFKRKPVAGFNEFVYRALLAISMNIIVPNADPNVTVDVFDIPINADYIRKVGLGITVLLHRLTVPNESCTNYKVRVFLELIQTCESVENLLEQFQLALSDPEFEDKQTKFDAEREKSLIVEEGGARRRRTHNKKHRPKRTKRGTRTRRGTRRMRYKKK